jgi:hypothetical protein
MKEYVRQFKVQLEDGQLIVVIEYNHIHPLDKSHMVESKKQVQGIADFETPDGHKVNQKDEETYVIVRSGLTGTKVRD